MSRSPMSPASALWKAKYPMFWCTREELQLLKQLLPTLCDRRFNPSLYLRVVKKDGTLARKVNNNLKGDTLPFYLYHQGYEELMYSVHDHPVKYYATYIWVIKLINYNQRRGIRKVGGRK